MVESSVVNLHRAEVEGRGGKGAQVGATQVAVGLKEGVRVSGRAGLSEAD